MEWYEDPSTHLFSLSYILLYCMTAEIPRNFPLANRMETPALLSLVTRLWMAGVWFAALRCIRQSFYPHSSCSINVWFVDIVTWSISPHVSQNSFGTSGESPLQSTLAGGMANSLKTRRRCMMAVFCPSIVAFFPLSVCLYVILRLLELYRQHSNI